MDLKAYLTERRDMVDRALDAGLPESQGLESEVVKAMRYSLFAGGKRLRPILCLAGCGALGGSEEAALPVACALEMIHTYSLIHDDLPLMDDDDFRRGRPTNHKVFGEAVAVLAGDALLTEAFAFMVSEKTTSRVPLEVVVRVVDLIALATGYRGMVGGQAVDIRSQGKKADFATVDFIHRKKTAALITASVLCGGLVGGGDEQQLKALHSYGENIGLAFQISDDILDIEGESDRVGKGVGKDELLGKVTFPGVVGLAKSKEVRVRLLDTALESLSSFDDRAEPLREIARYIVERKK